MIPELISLVAQNDNLVSDMVTTHSLYESMMVWRRTSRHGTSRQKIR